MKSPRRYKLARYYPQGAVPDVHTQGKKHPQLTLEQLEEATGLRQAQWSHQCHVVSCAVVSSGIIPGARVARGHCVDVGTHSWVVLGDPYDPDAWVLDLTLWSYLERYPAVCWLQNLQLHMPTGIGSLSWYDLGVIAWAPASAAHSKIVELTPTKPLTKTAQAFLKRMTPEGAAGIRLDQWCMLLGSGRLGGWPAREIYRAARETPELRALVPIDIQGMVLGSTCNGLYPVSPEKNVKSKGTKPCKKK